MCVCVCVCVCIKTLLIRESRQVNSKQAFCCVLSWTVYHQDKVHSIPFFRYFTAMKIEGSLAIYRFLFGSSE